LHLHSTNVRAHICEFVMRKVIMGGMSQFRDERLVEDAVTSSDV